MAHATLTPEVEAVLRGSTITGNTLVLPNQLERKLYEAVNKVLLNCGGRWKRGVGHVFGSDPREKLGIALETGVAEDTKKTLQAFYTPAAVAARVVELAEVAGKSVLEPSCGEGALIAECIAQGAGTIDAFEIDPETAVKAGNRFKARVHLDCADFLKKEPEPVFDRCVMNPPFSKNQDIKHVAHAFKFLKSSGGILVAVMSPLAPDKPAFTKAIGDHSFTVEDVEAGAFKESGTPIRTVIVRIVT